MPYRIVTAYLVLVNAAGWLLMLADKRKAQRGRWRIPEKVLFAVAFFGGSIGSIVGMYMFRHKSRHPKFMLGLPLILFLQLILVKLLVA